MAAINDFVLEIENIKKDMIPVIKFLAEFEKQFLSLILEKLIILPDFSREENEKKQEYENFHDFMKNLNIFFYANIQSFDKELRNYLSVGENFSISNISETALPIYNCAHKISETFTSQILHAYKKVGDVTNRNCEFIHNIISSMYKQEVYDKSETETESKKIYEQKFFIPQILPIYEKIGEVSNTTHEIISNLIGSNIINTSKSTEVYDKSEKTEGGKIYEQKLFIPQILPLYEKIGEVSNTTHEIISNLIGSNIINTSKNTEVYEKETHTSEILSSFYSNLSSALEIHKTFENTVKENIIEMSNLADVFKTNEMFALIQSAKPEIPEGINYAASIPEIYKKFKIFSEENGYIKYVNEVVERTTSTINNDYISSNLYGHTGSEFMNSLISYENTKIDNAFSLISATAPSTFPAATTNKTINNTFNISITAKSTSEEQELRELGKKIGKIINEEIRRAGI